MRLVADMQKVFPKLDLDPTIESTMIKLAEEVGECSEIVGKVRGMSGEDRQAVLLKLLSRDMGREIAEVMSRQVKIEAEALNAIADKYQKLRDQVEAGALGDQEIQARIARELLDIMQTCATFMYQLDVDLDKLLTEHQEKLTRRGYIKQK